MIFEKLKNKFLGSKSVMGIDIGSSSIKVVQLKNVGGIIILETYGSISTGPYANVDIGKSVKLTTDNLVTVMKDLTREANVKTNIVSLSIPFNASFVSLIKLPDLDDKYIAQAIETEAAKYIPVPMEEVSIDWFLPPRYIFEDKETDEKKRYALLIAIHNSDLQHYRDIIQKLNYDVRFFEIEIFGSIRSTLGSSKTPTVIVDIGARTTKFYVVDHGIVIKSYFINQGGQTVTQVIETVMSTTFEEAEELKRRYGLQIDNEAAQKAIVSSVDDILTEVNRVVGDYQTKYKKDIARLIFTGGGSGIKGLLNHAKEKTYIMPELANSFEKVSAPNFANSVLEEVGPEFSVAVGAALRLLLKE